MRTRPLRPLLPASLLATACAVWQPAVAPEPGGAVAAASPEAAAAGRAILAAGGNAIDAAIAVAFSLGVTEPAGSGLCGQAYLLVQRPGEEPFVVNGSTLAPAATPADASAADLRGRKAATVPSMVKVMQCAYERFGSGAIAWADLLAPAIADAEHGFVLGPFRHAAIARQAEELRTDPPTARVFLRPDGSVPAIGDRVAQPALAGTLRRLAEHGGDDFYRGEIAAAIAADMAAHGGWMAAADLAAFPEPEVGPALHARYRGRDVYTLPWPTGGWVVLTALAELAKSPAADLAEANTRTIAIAEALRTAHDQRLLSPLRDPEGGETTHFAVVDGGGTVVSATLSLNNYFGAKVMSAELGLLYNDYMREFVLDQPGHPFALRAGAKPYSSMSATIVAEDGQPRLALGSPGGRRIISAVVQVLSNWADRGLDLTAAVAAPRLHVVPERDALMVEAVELPRDVMRHLEQRGFSLAAPLSSLATSTRNPYFGGVHAVALRADGKWVGAADPRRDGAASSAREGTPGGLR